VGGGVAGAGLEVGGGDVVLPIAHLQLEVAESELQEGVGMGHHIGVAPGRSSGPRHIWRSTTPEAGPLVAPCPQLCCA
jgi:hypothetical protein